jgi:hypothetical protein
MAERVFPQNKTELLDEIQNEWLALQKVVDKLAPEKMLMPDAGGWSPKDNLAHLTEWMKILLGYHIDNHPSHEVIGIAPEVTEDWDFEAMNKLFFERNRLRSVDDVMDELKRVYAEVITRLKSIPFDDLKKPRYADDPEKQPLLNWVLGNTTEHFAEHRANIEKNL